MLVDTVTLYRQALSAVNTAYDRTLLASAKSIGELLDVEGEGADAIFHATVPYAALEAFEADNRSRMVYRISNVKGELVDGEHDLAVWQGNLPDRGPYAALVDFYDDQFRGDDVRVAVLLQPVASQRGRGMATIQVAETLELRRTLARQILIDTLWRQTILASVIALIVVVVVQRATRPVRDLSARLRARPQDDLTPIDAPNVPRELSPLIDATNQVMARLQLLLDNQKRFVRDASHQLRTPLAVLKVQVQSALRGDVEPVQALYEINGTVERATVLANQMLALTKVEQLRQQDDTSLLDLAVVVRAVALDVSPLIAEKDIDFEIQTVPAQLRAHEWMLRELARNLLHNAIKHSPVGAHLSVRLVTDERHAALTVADSGPGINSELRSRLFQPFSAGHAHSGSGLGLVICRDIALALGGTITLENRESHGRIVGLDATVRLPLEQSST
ncbi:MAG TPA: sensor histidine kinase N-terminal domain-containing protein [Burkholderiaceae bacterium]|nr:sensor histidine kinase N-terminal domain-containing protein [Burkholderiaceae bacterium]